MKVVLVALYDVKSSGVRILHALLREHGLDVTSVFFNDGMTSGPYRDDEVELLARTVAAERPDLIGIALRSPLFVLFRSLAAHLRRHTKAPILAGGHHPTICPAECLDVADLVCVGEGEGALVELCERMSRGEPIDDVRNIWLRKDGRIIANPIRPLVEDLDAVPFPDYSSEGKRYVIHGRLVAERLAPSTVRRVDVLTGRGCVYHCSYCFNHQLEKICRDAGQYRRRRSPANVIAELRQLRERFPNLESVFFSDRIFLQDEDWIAEFCELYGRDIRIPFGCFGHFSTTSADMLRRARAAGLTDLTIGLQSGSMRILRDVYNRRTSRRAIIEGARAIADTGLVPHYDMISNNPYETDETHRETLELLFEMPRPYHLRQFQMRHFPATTLTKRLLEDGLISEHEVESRRDGRFVHWSSTLDTGWGKPDQEIFWDCVYYMWQAGFPRTLVEAVADSATLRRNPRPLAEALRWGVKRPAYVRAALARVAGYLRAGKLRAVWDEHVARSYVGRRWGY